MTTGDRTEQPGYFSDKQVAMMLGVNHVSVRRWRTQNKTLGVIKYGPPYEYRGASVIYPKDKFYTWCAQVKLVNGVPHTNLPITATIPLPKAEQRLALSEDADD